MLAGLLPSHDFIIGTPDIIMENEEDFYYHVQNNVGTPIRFYVYNTQSETVREVELTPSNTWGGTGLLGAEVGYGFLHRIPFSQKVEVASTTTTTTTTTPQTEETTSTTSTGVTEGETMTTSTQAVVENVEGEAGGVGVSSRVEEKKVVEDEEVVGQIVEEQPLSVSEEEHHSAKDEVEKDVPETMDDLE
eukprot:TRINITY_DN2219_c0_g2_i2.p1 TRINITY_DN2219_c0_g2~~TRINITY_DN2219_c0_g2_i2.p1  ORF type:complete len:190 (-),score=66.62 TRINITY_DN2219_c0_g2_i2:726-1295(-)